MNIYPSFSDESFPSVSGESDTSFPSFADEPFTFSVCILSLFYTENKSMQHKYYCINVIIKIELCISNSFIYIFSFNSDEIISSINKDKMVDMKGIYNFIP